MNRFISPEDLARDRRFKRAQGQNALLASLPDEVDTLVRVMESIAPKLRERVAGTELEAVFDELGPGFTFLANARVHQPGSPGAEMQLKNGRFGKYFGCTNADCKHPRKLLKSAEVAPPKMDPPKNNWRRKSHTLPESRS